MLKLRHPVSLLIITLLVLLGVLRTFSTPEPVGAVRRGRRETTQNTQQNQQGDEQQGYRVSEFQHRSRLRRLVMGCSRQ